MVMVLLIKEDESDVYECYDYYKWYNDDVVMLMMVI